MKFKHFLVVIFFCTLFLVISGCGEKPDCSTKGDEYTVYEYSEEKGMCVVSERIEKNKCGNGIIEEGETYCNCNEDVSKTHPEKGCANKKGKTTKGEYLKYSCNDENKCVLMPNEKVTSVTKELSYLKNRYVDLSSSTIELEKPLLTDSGDDSVITITIKRFNTANTVKNLTVEDISLKDSSGVILASSQVGSELGKDGKIIKKLKVKAQSYFLTRKRLQLQVNINYNLHKYDYQGNLVDVVNKKVKLANGVGRWPIITASLD